MRNTHARVLLEERERDARDAIVGEESLCLAEWNDRDAILRDDASARGLIGQEMELRWKLLQVQARERETEALEDTFMDLYNESVKETTKHGWDDWT